MTATATEENITSVKTGMTVHFAEFDATVEGIEKQDGGYVLTLTASTLSEGSLTIIVGIACLAVGAVGMYLFMKKKKPAVASGENTDE